MNGSAAAAAASAAAVDAASASHVAATLSIEGYSPDSWGGPQTAAFVSALSSKLGGLPTDSVAVSFVGLAVPPRTVSMTGSSDSSYTFSSPATSSSSSSASPPRRRLHQFSSSSSDFTATGDVILNGSTLLVSFTVHANGTATALGLATAMTTTSSAVQLALLSQYGLSNATAVALTNVQVVKSSSAFSLACSRCARVDCLTSRPIFRAAFSPPSCRRAAAAVSGTTYRMLCHMNMH